MKISRLSLVAALALSSCAFAFDITQHDIKIDGNVKLWYQTMDHQGIDDKGMFQFDAGENGSKTAPSRNEWGNVSAQIRLNGKANDHLTYGATINGVTSMGFNGHITGAETTRTEDDGLISAAETGKTQIPFWFHEIFADYKSGNTNYKLGRQELDTPLAFTEKWNATSNSFEAFVVTNRDVKDTAIIGAWVSKGNGTGNSFSSAPQVFGATNTFNNYMGYSTYTNVYGVSSTGTVNTTLPLGRIETNINPGGMLLIGAKNNSIKNIPLQAWYYNTPDVMQALWLQADVKPQDFGFLKKTGFQVIGAGIGTNGTIQKYLEAGRFDAAQRKTDDTYAGAAKVSTTLGMLDTFAAFSQTTKGNLPVANTATNYKKTMLPTQSIFSDGMVAAQPDTTACMFGAGTKIGADSSLKLTYAHYEVGSNRGYFQPNAAIGGPASFGWIANWRNEDMKINEVDVVFSTKYKDITISPMYIYVDNTYVPGYTTAANLGSNFSGRSGASADRNYGTHANHIVRIVATLTF